ncbi:coiled-coil domain-containing protein 177-like [Chiloscyllium plagiosum]|uniref:coiled-coil domain-containing protein 177-like n=1 Tax=Chiloscyllium plagiosum TaxID=36176 RepID=UPI001CB86A5C|nr:coiled-coil domain-containing protein 177-like [Chiloscyllium plagiosum]
MGSLPEAAASAAASAEPPGASPGGVPRAAAASAGMVRAAGDASAEPPGASPGGVPRRQESPMFRLDLDNFDSSEAEGSRYVLTSPRSLEACARCGVRPVELLHRGVNEFARGAPGRSMRVASGLYEVYERDRRRKLRDCRQEREEIIREEEEEGLRRRRRRAGGGGLLRNSLPPSPSPGRARSLGLGPGPGRSRSQSVDQLQRKPPAGGEVASSDSGASSCSSAAAREAGAWSGAVPRGRPVQAWGLGKSLSLGDLCQSPETAQKVARMAREVRRSARAEVPARDRKIAALMLARHQEEELLSSRSHRTHVEWEARRRREAARREAEERERQSALRHGQRAWESRREARRSQLSREQGEAASVRQQRSALHEEKWRLLAGSQERQRRGRREHARLEARERKAQQEQQLRAQELEDEAGVQLRGRLLHQKLALAGHKKEEKEQRQAEQRKLANAVERLKHEAALREISREVEMERKVLRRSLEQKLARSQEKYEQLVEKRNRELRERASREELQIRRARVAAEQHEREHQQHLEALARAADRRLQHATQVAQEKIHEVSRRAVESRAERERVHRLNRTKLQEDEECKRREIQDSISRKLEKSERIFRERQIALENSRSLARASFQIRDKVRLEINTRTFDKMALEAELHAHLDKKPECTVYWRDRADATTMDEWTPCRNRQTGMFPSNWGILDNEDWGVVLASDKENIRFYSANKKWLRNLQKDFLQGAELTLTVLSVILKAELLELAE